MRLDAAASSVLRSALAGSTQRATWLGVSPAALYFRIPSAPGVIALVAHDAVRLPCAVVLPTVAAELPLTSIADGAVDAIIGANVLAWTGPAGPVVVHSVREWAPARVRSGRLAADAIAALSGILPAPAALGIDSAHVTLLMTEPAAAVDRLLGRGPGLTPSGDDVLAGFLVGARACGLDATDVRAAVAALATVRTTALSAALLWHSARGECVDEVAAVVADPSDHVFSALLRIGHTSGAALATGLVAAASAARCARDEAA